MMHLHNPRIKDNAVLTIFNRSYSQVTKYIPETIAHFTIAVFAVIIAPQIEPNLALPFQLNNLFLVGVAPQLRCRLKGSGLVLGHE